MASRLGKREIASDQSQLGPSDALSQSAVYVCGVHRTGQRTVRLMRAGAARDLQSNPQGFSLLFAYAFLPY